MKKTSAECLVVLETANNMRNQIIIVNGVSDSLTSEGA